MKYRWTIRELPPSNNKYIGRNARWEYSAEKRRWEELIFLNCRPRPEKPLEKARVRLTYFFGTRLRRDPDNYSGKFILDGLVKAGIIADDSFGNIELVLVGKYDHENPRTVIEVESE